MYDCTKTFQTWPVPRWRHRQGAFTAVPKRPTRHPCSQDTQGPPTAQAAATTAMTGAAYAKATQGVVHSHRPQEESGCTQTAAGAQMPLRRANPAQGL